MKSDQLPLNSPVSSWSEACSSNSTSNVPASHASLQNGGLLQLATVPNGEVQSQQVDPNHIEMEVDDVPNVCNINMLPNSYTLMLPQTDLQPTDLSIYNDSTSNTKRTAKRKRLLSELSEFAAKRRSTRVRNPAVKKAHDNINYQELLQKFLPSKLIGDGKYDDQDDDSDPLSQDKASGDHTYGQAAENEKKDNSKVAIDSSYLSSTEKDDVTHFIANNQSNGGIIDLLYNYTVSLAKKNHFVW
ncbi:Calcineurin-binding protein cabin-1, partial [Stegodyphus mimosarum]